MREKGALELGEGVEVVSRVISYKLKVREATDMQLFNSNSSKTISDERIVDKF